MSHHIAPGFDKSVKDWLKARDALEKARNAERDARLCMLGYFPHKREGTVSLDTKHGKISVSYGVRIKVDEERFARWSSKMPARVRALFKTSHTVDKRNLTDEDKAILREKQIITFAVETPRITVKPLK